MLTIVWTLPLIEELITYWLLYDRDVLMKELMLKMFIMILCNTPPWVFFTFFERYKLSNIAQNIAYCHNTETSRLICILYAGNINIAVHSNKH